MSPKFKEYGDDFKIKFARHTGKRLDDYFISYNRIPWMKHACISDALEVRMSGKNAIEWPKLDVDLEIDSLKHPERYPLIMKRNELEVL